MLLSCTFFSVYFVLALFRTVEELQPSLLEKKQILVKLQLLFWRARNGVNLAPMLCILFIATRMRALQVDPLHGNPQPWAQTCFWICSWAVVFQVFSSIIFPLLDKNAQLSSSSVQGQVVIIFSKRSL